ncbi:hypothetical protein Trydic_g6155 [Trypoxylus dichotomus]
MMCMIPIFLYNTYHFGPALGSIGCKFYGFLGGISGTVSICILSAISFDRFHVIKYPLTRQPSHTRTKFFIFICWIYGAVFSLIPAFDIGLGTYVPEAYLVSCSYEYLTYKPQVKHFIFAFFIAAWVVPFCLILFSYINIVYVVFNSRHAATNSFGGSYRHIKKKQKIKQEIKVAIIVLIVICVWFVAWTPYAIVSLLGIFGREDLITPLNSMVPAVFCKSASCLDPYIYALTHSKFKDELQKVFKSSSSRKIQSKAYSITTSRSNNKNKLDRDSVVEEIIMVNLGGHHVPPHSRRVFDQGERPQQSAISQPSWWARPSFTDDCSLAKARKLVRNETKATYKSKYVQFRRQLIPITYIRRNSLASRHSYNTRYSAKLRAANSKHSFDGDICSPRKLALDADVEKETVSRVTPKLLVFKTQTKGLTSRWKNKTMPRGVHHPLVSCGHGPSCMERFCWYLVCLIAIVSLVALSTYLLHKDGENSDDSYQYFSKELHKIKEQILHMKDEVRDVFTSKDDTEKKLEAIEQLLRDLKQASQKGGQKCPAKREPKQSKTIRKEIAEALNLYADDKTGKTDFALESAGGSIAEVRDTESYPTSDRIRFWGVIICTKANSARAILQPGSLPGECWAFKGSKGCAIIRLLGKVRITGVTLEHISSSMSPSGEITTAPKDFTIKGMKSINDEDPDFLGKFTYDVRGKRLQYFDIANCERAYSLIEFKVLNNHGHPEFTCVYRLRVHGELQG